MDCIEPMGLQRVRHDSNFHFQRTTPKLQYLKPGSSSVTEEINWSEEIKEINQENSSEGHESLEWKGSQHLAGP